MSTRAIVPVSPARASTPPAPHVECVYVAPEALEPVPPTQVLARSAVVTGVRLGWVVGSDAGYVRPAQW